MNKKNQKLETESKNTEENSSNKILFRQMREEARKGLEWRKEYGRGGTSTGVSRARDIINGD